MMRSLTGPRGLTGRRAAAVVVPAALLLTLTACGGSSSAGASATSATSAAARAGGMGNNAEFQKIQQCLTAAGIAVPTPSRGARPSGMPTGMPTGAPGEGGSPPSGAPGGANGGGNGGGRAGFGGMGTVLQSSAAKAALTACGLTVPTGRPSGAPSAPSATASS